MQPIDHNLHKNIAIVLGLLVMSYHKKFVVLEHAILSCRVLQSRYKLSQSTISSLTKKRKMGSEREREIVTAIETET